MRYGSDDDDSGGVNGRKALIWFLIFVITTLLSLVWGYVMIEQHLDKAAADMQGDYNAARQGHGL